MEGMRWYLDNSADTLLLVAVDQHAASTPGAYPCRVIGAFSPAEMRRPTPQAEDSQRVNRLLAEIGVPRNLLGCTYLRTGLTLLLAEPALGRAITRSLYPRIAQKHGTTAQGVERAIRHAIAQTFARDDGEHYRAALGRLASSVAEKPTNTEFLAQTAERLRLDA